MTLEEFLLRLLVEAARDAALTRPFLVHDDADLKYQLLETAMAIETTIEVWQAMERINLRDLLKPITFGRSWEEAK